ncbi:MAG: hypothetical protein GKR89_12780 [Candidatus Latescibacteria bacterium]|nr:hypothetical protein [Candidatus Latescibacterota bacterium]
MGCRLVKLLVPVLWLLGQPVSAAAGTLRIDSQQQWASWTFPVGVVELADEGGVRLRRFQAALDAVESAPRFWHPNAAKRQVWGGIHAAGSRPEQAHHILDGNPETWWQPSAQDSLSEWAVEIDLGRLVQARTIRLRFPNREGARPLSQFGVLVSDGRRRYSNQDIFQYDVVGSTSRPNRSEVVEYQLSTPEADGAEGLHLVSPVEGHLPYRAIQYIRVVVLAQTPEAALADIEVETLGENIARGTVERGGGLRSGRNGSSIVGLADGDANSYWSINGAPSGDWRERGTWFEWDLGAVFWVDRLIIAEPPQLQDAWRRDIGQIYFELQTSEGSQATLADAGQVQSPVDYALLSRVDNSASGSATERRRLFDFAFAPRKMRYIFYHHEIPEQFYHLDFSLLEVFLYGGGYPARVEMTSGFIDLERVKTLKRIAWEGNTPPGTAIELRSRTGDTLQEEIFFYSKNGEEIPEKLWLKLPNSQKMPLVKRPQAGADWSEWSPVYRSGEAPFVSPSPRRFVQLQAHLLSEDPQVAPSLQAISLDFDEALVSGGVFGQITPRSVRLDSLRRLRLRLEGVPGPGDVGYDELVVVLPAPLADEVQLRIGDQVATPRRLQVRGDSLHIELPRAVQREVVEIVLPMRLTQTVSAFAAWVGFSGRPGIRQGIRSVESEALTVLVPEIPLATRLMRKFEVGAVVTPNGDGRNDRLEIRLLVVKTGQPPVLTVRDLSGRAVVQPVLLQEGRYAWSGRDSQGKLLPPGLYLVEAEIESQAKTERRQRLVRLVY